MFWVTFCFSVLILPDKIFDFTSLFLYEIIFRFLKHISIDDHYLMCLQLRKPSTLSSLEMYLFTIFTYYALQVKTIIQLKGQKLQAVSARRDT